MKAMGGVGLWVGVSLLIIITICYSVLPLLFLSIYFSSFQLSSETYTQKMKMLVI